MELGNFGSPQIVQFKYKWALVCDSKIPVLDFHQREGSSAEFAGIQYFLPPR